jgi:hypothetical protein
MTSHDQPHFRFRVDDQVTDAGVELNEDGLVVTGSEAWVVDGASGLADERLTPGVSDAHWLMERVTTHLGAGLSTHPVDKLTLVADLVYRDFDALNLPPRAQQYEYPSASLVGCAFDGRALSVVRLGDCTLLVQPVEGGPVHKFPRSPLRNLDDAVIAEMSDQQRQAGMTGKDAYRAALPHLRANRDLINEADGYPALTVGKNRKFTADIIEIPVTQPMNGLLCSDGFWRLVETFGLYSENSLITACFQEGLAVLVAKLRAAEQSDPDGRRNPRLKASDDATAIVFSLVS